MKNISKKSSSGLVSRLNRIADNKFDILQPKNNLSLKRRLQLLCGGPRRLFLHLLKPQYVKDQAARRKGYCKRCGACCQISWRCPHLFYDADQLACCRLYGESRALWCTVFPIDERCLTDRDAVGFTEPCGFRWPKSNN